MSKVVQNRILNNFAHFELYDGSNLLAIIIVIITILVAAIIVIINRGGGGGISDLM